MTGVQTCALPILPWLLDRNPERVRAVTRAGPPGRTDAGGFIEVDFGALRCHLTCIESGLHMWDEIRIFGDTGLFELRRPLDIPLGWQMVRWDRGRRPVETIEADDTPGAATRDFITAIADRRVLPACTFAQAWNSVRVVELAFESAGKDGAWLETGGGGNQCGDL